MTIRAVDNYEAYTWLDYLRRPNGVAIVGASNELDRPGGRVVAAMLRFGFGSALYPVSRTQREIQGIPAFRSVLDIPGVVDIAMLIVPARDIEDMLEECGNAGVKLVVIGAAGFSETGAHGEELEHRLRSVLDRFDMRAIGPNTNGLVCTSSGLALTFTPALHQPELQLRDGQIAFISQSGAIGGALFALAQTEGLGIGLMLNCGNEIDLGLEEVLVDVCGSTEFRPKVIAVYCEGMSDRNNLIRAAELAHANGCSLVILKVGTTNQGAEAATAHTAKLAGSDRVCGGVFRQLGFIRARTLSELLDVVRLLDAYGGSIGTRLSVASMSGGAGIIITDAAIVAGLEMANWPQVWQRRLDGLLPEYLSKSNPIDLAGSPFRDLGKLREILVIMDENPQSDVTVLAITNLEGDQKVITDAIIALKPKLFKPLIVVWFGGVADSRQRLNRTGIPSFAEPTQAVATLALISRASPGTLVTQGGIVPRTDRRRIIEDIMASGENDVLSPKVSQRILEVYNIPFAEQRVWAVSEMPPTDLTLPAIVKLSTDQLSHKSDLGAVVRVDTSADLERVAAELMMLAGKLGHSNCELLAQEVVEPGLELLIGMSRDVTFGPVISFGIGGVFAEAFDDIVVRLPVLRMADVTLMLSELRHQVLLRGFRHMPAVNAELVGPVVLAFASLVLEVGDLFEAIDLNPLIVNSKRRIVAVDALMIRARNRALSGTTPST